MDRVLRRAKRARQVLLALDFDGTLAEIVPTPAEARLPQGRKHLLGALARKPRFTVVLLSGRALEDLRERIGLPKAIYGGNHGLEMEGPGIHFIHPQAGGFRSRLDRLARKLEQALAGFAGALVEHKGLSLAVHYRRVPPRQRAGVWGVVKAAVEPLQRRGLLRVREGKAALDILPRVEWDKGRALLWLMERPRDASPPQAGRGGTLLIYLGDDRTDVEAVAVVRQRGGIGVRVGRPWRESNARFYLRGPREVALFLQRLVAEA